MRRSLLHDLEAVFLDDRVGQHVLGNFLQLLLRLRYRIRVDLGLAEDDYDHMLDKSHPRR